jgi:MinD-like ATPase involved in chromosome partitioning or flagellar assembly
MDRRSETDIALGFMRAIEKLPARWDVVLVDCPPSLGYLAIAPLTVCHEALVPVEAHYMALAGVTSLVETMDQIRARLNPSLKLGAVVPCRVNRTMHARAVVARLAHRYPEAIVKTQIRESIRLAEASSFKLPITVYAPESAGSEDYRALAAELFGPAHAPARTVRRVVTPELDAVIEPTQSSGPDAPATAFDRFRRVLRWSGLTRPAGDGSVERTADEPVGDLSGPER